MVTGWPFRKREPDQEQPIQREVSHLRICMLIGMRLASVLAWLCLTQIGIKMQPTLSLMDMAAKIRG